MNRKPGSVTSFPKRIGVSESHRPPSVWKDRSRPFPCSLPALGRRAAGAAGKPAAALLGFAPDEACRSGRVAAAEVGSYPTLSPLPPAAGKAAGWRFAFCCAVCPGIRGNKRFR